MTHSAESLSLRPTFLPATDTADERLSGQLVLRDGSRLQLLRAAATDADDLEAFLERLSPTERSDVRLSLGIDVEDLGELLASPEGRGRAFVARGGSADDDPIDGPIDGFAAYRVHQEGEARVTLAVDPSRRQLGLATLLLERIMVLAAQHGVDRLLGLAHEGNTALIELFRRDGFDVEKTRQETDDGAILRLVFSTRAVPEREGAGGLDDPVAARVYAAASLHSLFHPQSVAVVGASRDPESVGYRILDALLTSRFQGPVFPINPKASHVGSIRAYPSISAVGAAVDLAVIAVPSKIVAPVVDECIEAGVRSLVVITAGFAEVGEEGAAAQEELLAKVRKHGLRMVGPNCLGLLHTDPDVRLNASFAPIMPPPGTVALGSQSGALGIAIIALARRLGLGLSSFVSVGNKADVSGNDLLEFWEEDPRTQVVLFYLESFGNPRRFARIARRVGRTKPIVVVKAGRSGAGQRAASSHTAALTAADTAVDALFRQTGILRADTLEEMFSIARALVDQPLPSGRRVAVVTNAGGPGILCTDALEAAGLSVNAFSEETQARLDEFLPSEASSGNPVDMIASANPESYRRTVEIVLGSGEVDALVVIYTPAGLFATAEIGDAVSAGLRAAREAGAEQKPVYATVVGDEEATYKLQGEDDDETIPVFAFPEEIGRTLGKIAEHADWRRADPGVYPEPADQDLEGARKICRRALEERGAGWLSVGEALRVLAAAGLQIAPGGVAESADEAAEKATECGFPVAVKLASLEIVHKTEHGGVVLDLEDADAVRAAYREMAERLESEGHGDAMDGVLVQPMMDGTEVMIGVDQDPVFGPLVAFGLGGIHVEILRDVQFRVAPLSDTDVAEMVRGIRGYQLLEGYRGHPAADVDALEGALIRISRLAEAVPEIVSLDLNPLFALEPGDGYRVVDARIEVG